MCFYCLGVGIGGGIYLWRGHLAYRVFQAPRWGIEVLRRCMPFPSAPWCQGGPEVLKDALAVTSPTPMVLGWIPVYFPEAAEMEDEGSLEEIKWRYP